MILLNPISMLFVYSTEMVIPIIIVIRNTRADMVMSISAMEVLLIYSKNMLSRKESADIKVILNMYPILSLDLNRIKNVFLELSEYFNFSSNHLPVFTEDISIES